MSERLSNEELADAELLISLAFGDAAVETKFVRILAEVKERRASDLTADDVEALQWALWSMRDDRDNRHGVDRNLVDHKGRR